MLRVISNMDGVEVLFTWAIFVCLFNIVKLLDNGLARTPPMGWMSWGYYKCATNCQNHREKCLDEKLILSVADAMYNDGYLEAGYEYIIIDDCWSERHRGRDGTLVPDKRRFPHGMKYIADYILKLSNRSVLSRFHLKGNNTKLVLDKIIGVVAHAGYPLIHARGLKFGMYTTVGKDSCERYPGSRGFFGLDARTFAEWGVDYLKVDGCFVEEEFLNTAYIKLGRHLNNTRRPIVYSCSWPYYIEFNAKKKPDLDGVATHCNLWRVFHDVALSWEAVRGVIYYFELQYSELSPYHGPGQWNDPDMLILGTDTLTENQSRVQLVVFAMLSAPLILSCDMNLLSDYEKSLLQNMDLIAIDQDPLGVMAEPFDMANHTTLWVKRHYPMKGDKYHAFSFALVNLSPTKDPIVSFTPGDYGLESLDGYTVLDVLSGVYIRNITISDTITAFVPPEDAILYTLFAL